MAHFDKTYRKLAEKYKLDVRIITEVCNSPFKFINSVIKKGDTKPIRLSYLFKIYPKNNKIQYLNETNDARIESKET